MAEEVTCEACGEVYSGHDSCPSCGSSMERPDYVEDADYFEKFPRFGVQVTEGYDEEDDKKLRIRKLVPNNNPDDDHNVEWRNITVKDAEQLNRLLGALKKLKSEAGWKEKSELLDELHVEVEDEENEKVREMLQQYPSFFNEVLENMDFENLDESDFELLKETVENLNETTLRAERRIKEQFKDLLNKLTEEQEGYGELATLLEDWHLIQVTSASNIALERLEFLESFEDMIHNDEIYEIKGDDSIHRALERNLWILNEEYWLLQSNKSLRRFIQDEFDEEDAGEEQRRPDFVCATQGNELVIAEIKRPSHKLKKEDVEQLDDYFYFADKYRGEEFDDVKGFLIGNKHAERAKRRAESHENIQILTYQEIFEGARNRYREYLDAMQELDVERKHPPT